MIIGLSGSTATTTWSPIATLTMKNGLLSISYFDDGYHDVSVISKRISVDPQNLTIKQTS